MDANPVIEMLGRPLRLAVIGGGPGSFIGAMHRTAARLDGRYQLVAGVVSTDPDRSRKAALSMGIDPSRAYADAITMLDAERERGEGAEVVAIMTPNDTHHLYAMAALDRGFDVICDKPMTNTLDEALDIVAKVQATGLVFCLTHNYTGYPMVRQARALVEDGQLGEIRLVQVEYVQGGKADETDPDPAGGLPWRYNPVRGGPSLVMGDIGTHAHNLVRFVSGREVTEVSAQIGHVIPERLVDDYGSAMLRFDNGARGSFWVTQTAAGVENSLGIRVSGTKGSLEWHQERPTRLTFKPIDGPAAAEVSGAAAIFRRGVAQAAPLLFCAGVLYHFRKRSRQSGRNADATRRQVRSGCRTFHGSPDQRRRAREGRKILDQQLIQDQRKFSCR